MVNPKDPIVLSGPEAQRVLFTKMSQECSGFQTDQVLGAAANLIINGLRQTYTTRSQAEIRFNELFGRMKQLLLDHYDSTGRKKGIFPYTQNIDVPLIKFPNKINGQMN